MDNRITYIQQCIGGVYVNRVFLQKKSAKRLCGAISIVGAVALAMS